MSGDPKDVGGVSDGTVVVTVTQTLWDGPSVTLEFPGVPKYPTPVGQGNVGSSSTERFLTTGVTLPYVDDGFCQWTSSGVPEESGTRRSRVPKRDVQV